MRDVNTRYQALWFIDCVGFNIKKIIYNISTSGNE